MCRGWNTLICIRERVIKARQLQLLRLQGTNLYCNAQMGRRELNKHCQMEAAAEKLLAKFFTALGLSARSHDRIIKVARTPIWQRRYSCGQV